MLTLERPMAKKKSEQVQEPKDVHLRLPPEYGVILDAISAMTARPKTVEVQIAIERRAKSLGVTFTPNWPETV
jgi:predicted DNA-binding protein